MNYIYDIYLNLNETNFDFFDWNKNDKLIHIKKIPIFKINEEILKKIINNQIKINEKLLLKIYNKTETFNKIEKINYCALFADNNTILAVEFDENGKSIRKSFLYVEEELDVLETIKLTGENNLNFNILRKEKILFKTRKQLKEEIFIKNELKNMDENRLNYIYFECFGKKEKNKRIILDNINKLPKNSKIYKKLYEILKLTSTT